MHPGKVIVVGGDGVVVIVRWQAEVVSMPHAPAKRARLFSRSSPCGGQRQQLGADKWPVRGALLV